MRLMIKLLTYAPVLFIKLMTKLMMKHLNVQRTALSSEVAYSFRLLPPSVNLSADAL